jgi:hypothetical protein
LESPVTSELAQASQSSAGTSLAEGTASSVISGEAIDTFGVITGETSAIATPSARRGAVDLKR